MIRPALLCLLVNLVFVVSASGDDSQGNPRLDYMLQCQGCHGADGGPRLDADIPTLIDLVPRFLTSEEGREFLLRVPGVSQAPLSNEAVARLMNWLLENYRSSDEAPHFTPYLASEVERARKSAPLDVAATRARLLAGER